MIVFSNSIRGKKNIFLTFWRAEPGIPGVVPFLWLLTAGTGNGNELKKRPGPRFQGHFHIPTLVFSIWDPFSHVTSTKKNHACYKNSSTMAVKYPPIFPWIRFPSCLPLHDVVWYKKTALNKHIKQTCQYLTNQQCSNSAYVYIFWN